MAKKQTFADKLTKSKLAASCPVCSDPYQFTLVLKPTPSQAGGTKMKESRVAVCKCNRKEVYG
jgi:hypothetical protein